MIGLDVDSNVYAVDATQDVALLSANGLVTKGKLANAFSSFVALPQLAIVRIIIFEVWCSIFQVEVVLASSQLTQSWASSLPSCLHYVSMFA